MTASESKVPLATVNWLSLTLLTVGGWILGAIGYFVAAIILEIRRGAAESTLTYGQQAGMVSAPLCAIMCAMIGLSFGLATVRHAIFGTVMLIVTGCLGGLVVNSMWSEQIAQHGRDPSEIVLYYPPMTVAIASLLFAIPTGLIANQRRNRRNKQCGAPKSPY